MNISCIMQNSFTDNKSVLLLLLLSHFSATPSLGFSRQEHWSGLPFPSPTHKSESEVTQSCPTLRNPMDCSLPGSSVHGIFQARVLEWGVIAFSEEICDPLVCPPTPSPNPWHYWFPCLHSLAFSRTSYSWNYIICSFSRLTSFTQ